MTQSLHTDPPTPTESTAEHILVVLDADDPGTTLRSVLRDLDASAAEFHLLMAIPTAEYERGRRARVDAGVPGPYTIGQLAEQARRSALRVGREHLGQDDVEFEAIGDVGRKRDCVRRLVRTNEYEGVYVADQPPSIWQRFLGDEPLSAELTRHLPEEIPVVAVDDVASPPIDGPESDAAFEPGQEFAAQSRDT